MKAGRPARPIRRESVPSVVSRSIRTGPPPFLDAAGRRQYAKPAGIAHATVRAEMPLTNAEKQARYVERRKAERAKMIDKLETIRDLSHGRTGPTLRAIHEHAKEGLGDV